MARDANVKGAEEEEIYYYLSHCLSHIDFSAIMNHCCLGNVTGMESGLKEIFFIYGQTVFILRLCVQLSIYNFLW